MEKKQFDFKSPENVTITIGEQSIEITPFLSLNQQTALINSYLDTYFKSDKNNVPTDEWDTVGAEYALKLAVVDLCSSIIIDGAFENLFYSSAYQDIENVIENYDDFRFLLDEVVDNIKEQIVQKNSLASLVEKVGVLLGELGESMKNFKPEDLEKLKEVGKELVDKISQNPLVGEVFSDAAKK